MEGGALGDVMNDGSSFAIHGETRTFWVKVWHAAGTERTKIRTRSGDQLYSLNARTERSDRRRKHRLVQSPTSRILTPDRSLARFIVVSYFNFAILCAFASLRETS
jgi:hypothetical protein